MNSDDEQQHGRVGASSAMDNDELSLPKATINKIISEYLPSDFSCAKDAKDLIAECCKEFVMAISSEANEICEKESKKTMTPEHVLAALKALGFEKFVDQVEETSSEHKELAKGERQSKKNKAAGSGLSPEELLKAQEELFAASRAKFEAGAGGSAPAAA